MRALRWSSLGYSIPQIVTPFVTIYIAYLLSPVHFGLVAIGILVNSFVELFLFGGLTTALIQMEGNADDIRRAGNTAFTASVILSLLTYVALFLSAPWISDFFGNESAAEVIRVLGISLIINAFGETQQALLRKSMDFKAVFHRQVAPLVAQVGVALPLALGGHGVWALVYGKVAGDALGTLIIWLKSDWKPKLSISLLEQAALFKFGGFVILSSLLWWISSQVDVVILGAMASTHDLGLYKTGLDLNKRVLLVFIIPIVPVFFAQACALETKELRKAFYLRTKEYVGAIVLPIMFGVILVSPYLENLVLGARWFGVSFVLMILAPTGLIQLWALMSGYFKAIGKPHLETKVLFIDVVICIPLYWFSVQYGFTVFMYARVLAVFIEVALFLAFESRELNMGFIRLLSPYRVPFLASSLMFLAGFVLQNFGLKDVNNFIAPCILVVFAGSTYVVLLMLLDRALMRRLLDTVQSFLAGMLGKKEREDLPRSIK